MPRPDSAQPAGAIIVSPATALACPAQGRRHHHQVCKLRHDLGNKKHGGGRQDDSQHECDEVNAFVIVDWIGHSLGAFNLLQVGGSAPAEVARPSSAGRSQSASAPLASRLVPGGRGRETTIPGEEAARRPRD
jgi:hypothetical protein